MRDAVKMNAMRSGVVVVASLAFGYLSFRVGYKPFLDNAQYQAQAQDQAQAQAAGADDDSPPPEQRQKQQSAAWIQE